MVPGRVGDFSSVGHHGRWRLGVPKGIFLSCNLFCSLFFYPENGQLGCDCTAEFTPTLAPSPQQYSLSPLPATLSWLPVSHILFPHSLILSPSLMTHKRGRERENPQLHPEYNEFKRLLQVLFNLETEKTEAGGGLLARRACCATHYDHGCSSTSIN